MSKYITVVLEYKDGQEQPRFGAGMEVLGGNVDSVQFDNALVEFEKMDDDLLRTKAELEDAVERIKDMLRCDDGQAFKEAEKFLCLLSNQPNESSEE